MKRASKIFLALLALGALLASSPSPATGDPARTDESAILRDFADAVVLLEEHYADKLDYEQITKMAILGMLHTLDPHSHYYDKREFARFRIEQTSQYFGIGATIGTRNGKVYILAPFPDTPAYRGGLRYGDQIVAINGESIEGWPSAQVSARLRGPRGTAVEVQILRAGEKKPRTVKLVRDAVPLPSISSAYLLQGDVGYVSLQRGFNTTTDEELTRALSRLESQGMKALILDLRNNQGGLLDQAVRTAEKFLAQGQVILTQKSRASQKVYTSRNPHPNLTPLLVLVNENTASASEIVTAAIQEHDRGLVVGEPTFGKALVQTIMPLPFGAGLTLTTAKYLTPSGRLIQRTYDNLSFYDYYARHRPGARPSPSTAPPRSGPAFHSESGRTFYGGGGITPDIIVPATQLTEDQVRLQGAIFAFARELVAGLIPGLEAYRVEKIEFHHVLGDQEYRITDAVLDAFAQFVLAHRRDFHISAATIEKNREFARVYIRFEVATAAYGLETAAQALNEIDLQLLKALDAIPQATELAEKYRARLTAKRATSRLMAPRSDNRQGFLAPSTTWRRNGGRAG